MQYVRCLMCACNKVRNTYDMQVCDALFQLDSAARSLVRLLVRRLFFALCGDACAIRPKLKPSKTIRHQIAQSPHPFSPQQRLMALEKLRASHESWIKNTHRHKANDTRMWLSSCMVTNTHTNTNAYRICLVGAISWEKVFMWTCNIKFIYCFRQHTHTRTHSIN